MGTIKIKTRKCFIIAITLFVICNHNPKTEIAQIELGPSYPLNRRDDYYMVNNPPKDIHAIINLISKNLNITLREENLEELEFYSQIYYVETTFFNRHYKPHYKWYNPYIYDDIRDGQSHLEDRWVTVILKSDIDNCESCRNMPIYLFHKKGLKYYPNGFRNDPGKHWEKMKD